MLKLGLVVFVSIVSILLSRADISNVGTPSDDAPQWAREKNVFSNMDESPFGGFFFENNIHLKNFEREKFFPFIDKYGQFVHSEWTGKIHTDSDFKKHLLKESEFEKSLPPLPERDDFGGLICEDIKLEATGYFRVEKVRGRWFFVTPSGNLFWSIGVCAFDMSNSTRITGRENYFSPDAKIDEQEFLERLPFDKTKSNFFCFNERNIHIKYGKNRSAHLDTSLRRIQKWGINTLGCWSNKDTVKLSSRPFCALMEYPAVPEITTGGMATSPLSLPDFYSDEFPNLLASKIKNIAGDLQNPLCLGVFAGYKLFWQRSERFELLPRAVLSSPASQNAKIALRKMLENKYEHISKLNAAWSSSYKSWNDFLSIRDFFPNTPQSKIDMDEFSSDYTERYFKLCSDAVKAVNPKILFLGSRFAPNTPDIIIAVASKYCDAISLANYPKSTEDVKLPENSSDKPILLCEFNFCAQDRGVFGGGHSPVKTTDEAAKLLDAFINSAAESPSVVGVHWMRWIDAPASAKHNGENSASGLIDICDTPIYPLVLALRKASDNSYNIRLK